MIIYFNLDDENFLTGWSSTQSSEDDIRLTVKSNHEVLSNPFIFKYVDGELIKDEDKRQQLIDKVEHEANKPTDIERLEGALMELAMVTMNRVKGDG